MPERARACIARVDQPLNEILASYVKLLLTSFTMLITINHTLYLIKSKYITWPAFSK